MPFVCQLTLLIVLARAAVSASLREDVSWVVGDKQGEKVTRRRLLRDVCSNSFVYRYC